MRIELRLPEDSDTNPTTEYLWLWSAGKGVKAEGPLGDFVEQGVRRYRFDFEDEGYLSVSLKSVFPASMSRGPRVRARIVVEVDENGELPE